MYVFSNGDKSQLSQGAGLMFVTLPKVFATMPLGRLVGILFFLLVIFAALTSSISLLEALVAVALEKTKLTRVQATVIITILCMIPEIQVLHTISLINTLPGTILVYWGIGIPFAFFIIQSAVKGLPVELEESAMIDGCSRIGIFFKIVLPLLKPAITTGAVMPERKAAGYSPETGKRCSGLSDVPQRSFS